MQHDVIIIGGGPSAWAAALYLSRADVAPVVLAGNQVGGQLMLTTTVENFPGFLEGVEGPELMMKMRSQAERFGTKVLEEMVSNVGRLADGGFEVVTETQTHQAKAVIVATGASAVWLSVPGEKEFIGRGVSSCAVCDAAFFRGKKTVVVGGGDAAMEDALALARFAESVTIIHRRDSFRASKIMVDRVLQQTKISVIWNSVVEKIVGDTVVKGVIVRDMKNNSEKEMAMDGVFVAIGHRPATTFIKDLVNVDEKGYVLTRLSMNKQGLEMASKATSSEGLVLYPTMTSVEGVFAAGDCVDFRYRQASTASGFGVMAALDAQWWLEKQS
jgi:thioredoxin reductase (NADPH)